MTKIIIFIAIVCLAIVSGRGFGGNRRPGGGGWVAKLCANGSLAQSFLNQTQQLILNLQANGSYTEFLQERAQAIAYIQNATDVALLTSNCTAFFNGLSNARKADQQAEQQQEQNEQNALRLFQQIVRSLVGFRGFLDEDF